MAETALIVDQFNRSGVTPTAQTSDEVNGNSIQLTGKEFVRLTNGGVGANTVTFIDQQGDERLIKTDKAIVIAPAATVYVGDFPKARFANATGQLIMTWSGGTGADVVVEAGRNPDGFPMDKTEV